MLTLIELEGLHHHLGLLKDELQSQGIEEQEKKEIKEAIVYINKQLMVDAAERHIETLKKAGII